MKKLFFACPLVVVVGSTIETIWAVLCHYLLFFLRVEHSLCRIIFPVVEKLLHKYYIHVIHTKQAEDFGVYPSSEKERRTYIMTLKEVTMDGISLLSWGHVVPGSCSLCLSLSGKLKSNNVSPEPGSRVIVALQLAAHTWQSSTTMCVLGWR